MTTESFDNEKDFNKNLQEQAETSSKSMFTYSVSMIVSVFAEDEEKARASLNENGGFVSHRTVELKDAVEIYNPDE
jgi:hypothetical protein